MTTWLDEKPDRSDLVRWLAIRNDTGGGFYSALLARLISTGSLTELQEQAARQAWARVARQEAIRALGRGTRPDGYRRGNAEYRAGA